VPYRDLIRNSLLVFVCTGAIGALPQFAKAQAEIHSYIKSFPKDVLVNMADEATECVAYFRSVAMTLKDTKEATAAAQADTRGKTSLDWALQLTKWAGLKEESLRANLERATNYMLLRTQTYNIDPASTYGQLCKNVIERPKDRALHWAGWLSRRENWK
jgi:hypothetical protein